MCYMITQQTFSLKLDEKYLPSDIQATGNSGEKSKSLQKIESPDSLIHDLSGSSWIVLEEYG